MKKVMVFGTFDILHQGHLNFLKQARRLGDYLIVVVARDKFAKEAKGKLPKNNEKFRAKEVRRSKVADTVILGSKTHNYFRTIRTYKPEIVALGYDQKPNLPNLKKILKRHRLGKIVLVRLKSYKPHVFKSKLLLKSR
jgi:FAD synthetase